MLSNNRGGFDKSARDPFGQLGVERGQLIRQILHETSVLEIRGDHFGGEGAANLMNEFHGIARRVRRDRPQHIHATRHVVIDGFFRELRLAAWKVKVERALGSAAFVEDLCQSGRRIALNPNRDRPTNLHTRKS